jgi:SAM-dependent methyltransferase
MHAQLRDVDEVTEQFGDRYLQHEWKHVRHALERIAPVAGKRVLEVGCNVGATANVAARLGAAQVVGVDVDQVAVATARANTERWGGRLEFLHVRDTRRLPFGDESFDVVICNSVLEYVPPTQLPCVLAEISRVLAAGGIVLVHGTSNRLWPRETHSGQWLGNWLPTAVAPKRRRGVNPFAVKRQLSGYSDLLKDDPSAFKYIKRAQGMSPRWIRALQSVSSTFRISAGMLLPSFMVALRKPHNG